MVHGGCRSVGCYAMTDIKWKRSTGLSRKHSKVAKRKFSCSLSLRMTRQNLARYADDPNAPFWQVLKMGSMRSLQQGDHRRCYLRSALCVQSGGYVNDLDPSAPCPPEINSTPVAAALQSPVNCGYTSPSENHIRRY